MDDLSPRGSSSARGTLFVHACSKAMTAPLEWVLAELLEGESRLDWLPQPIAPTFVRATFEWRGASGTAAALASRLARLPHVRFEVTEHTASGFDQRFSFTPGLGIFRADIDCHGNLVVNESRLSQALIAHQRSSTDLALAIDGMIGTAWDAELEPFRIAADGDRVRWLNEVG